MAEAWSRESVDAGGLGLQGRREHGVDTCGLWLLELRLEASGLGLQRLLEAACLLLLLLLGARVCEWAAGLLAVDVWVLQSLQA